MGPQRAFEEIAEWTAAALSRWGLAGKLNELHANELKAGETLETCQMLAGRGDILLAAVATDSLLLGSSAALAHHRCRQLMKASNIPARTEEGRGRRERVLKLLENPRLHDEDYAFAAVLPLLATATLQRAFAYFAGDEHRDEMHGFELLVDKEAPPTTHYVEGTLLPTIGGDERFSLTTPEHWRRPPVHPLLKKAMHDDGDGLKPQALLGNLKWVDSVGEPSVQVADIVAWVIRRTMARPEETGPRQMFELLRPLLAGENGATFELFSTVLIRSDQKAMYSHLRQGVQPTWWLRPLAPDINVA